MLNAELKSKINGIWDTLFAAGLSNPVQAIEQITYLLFIKMLDDKETVSIRNAELFGSHQKYFMFDENTQNCRWSVFFNYNPDKMFENKKDKSKKYDVVVHLFVKIYNN